MVTSSWTKPQTDQAPTLVALDFSYSHSEQQDSWIFPGTVRIAGVSFYSARLGTHGVVQFIDCDEMPRLPLQEDIRLTLL